MGILPKYSQEIFDAFIYLVEKLNPNLLLDILGSANLRSDGPRLNAAVAYLDFNESDYDLIRLWPYL